MSTENSGRGDPPGGNGGCGGFPSFEGIPRRSFVQVHSDTTSAPLFTHAHKARLLVFVVLLMSLGGRPDQHARSRARSRVRGLMCGLVQPSRFRQRIHRHRHRWNGHHRC